MIIMNGAPNKLSIVTLRHDWSITIIHRLGWRLVFNDDGDCSSQQRMYMYIRRNFGRLVEAAGSFTEAKVWAEPARLTRRKGPNGFGNRITGQEHHGEGQWRIKRTGVVSVAFLHQIIPLTHSRHTNCTCRNIRLWEWGELCTSAAFSPPTFVG